VTDSGTDAVILSSANTMNNNLMESSVQRALAQSVADVLESMFFLEALADSEEPAGEPSPNISVHLTFDGDPPGRFRMRLERRAADSIAANFLGEDPEDLSSTQSLDVARELANMICGAVLSRIESRVSFRLSAPEIVTTEEATDSNRAREIAHTVETGNGTLTAAIQMEPRSCLSTPKSAS
jgi:CheY-specific phosphatase CheX